MNDQYEKVVNTALDAGYSIEQFQELLGKFKYSEDEILSASELYNLKKKGNTSSGSQGAEGSN